MTSRGHHLHSNAFHVEFKRQKQGVSSKALELFSETALVKADISKYTI